MKQDFNSTVWIIHTVLLTAAFGISIPIARSVVGLTLLRIADFTGSQSLQKFAVNILPAFIKPLVGVTAAVAISAPTLAFAQQPTISLDRIPSYSVTSPEIVETAAVAVTQDGSYTVQAGDSLWSIARNSLNTENPSAHEIDRAWRKLWQSNRAVIGPDPSIIQPGTILEVTYRD